MHSGDTVVDDGMVKLPGSGNNPSLCNVLWFVETKDTIMCIKCGIRVVGTVPCCVISHELLQLSQFAGNFCGFHPLNFLQHDLEFEFDKICCNADDIHLHLKK